MITDQTLTTPPVRALGDGRWQHARLGLFVHWGPYAEHGGEWDGQRVPGCAEHIRRQVPAAEYERRARAWSPSAFDAADLVDLAQRAGLGYLVFTAKHHDGFCMYRSPGSSYAATAGAWGQDPMRALRDAADAAGLPLGWYYSPRDWHHADYRDPAALPAAAAAYQRYRAYLQDEVEHLLRDYGPVSTLWFDGQDHTSEVAGSDALLARIRALSPETLVNDRIGRDGYEADYAIREGYVPDQVEPRPWETCLSLNYSWGFCRSDQRWCGVAELVRRACQVVGQGGNLLVNVGPDGEGRVPGPAREILTGFGAWMARNGGALRGTRAVPCADPDLRYTTDDHALYALVLAPAAGELLLPGLFAGMAPRLLGGATLPWRQGPDGVRVTVPTPTDELALVIELPGGTIQ